MAGIDTGLISNEVAPSAESSNRASAAKGRSIASMNTWELKYMAWESARADW